jgi:hypothetical protein
MAALSDVTANVICPVCSRTLTVQVRVRQVVHSTVFPDHATIHLALAPELPEFDDPDHVPAGHEECFTLTDEQRASIAALEAAQGGE